MTDASLKYTGPARPVEPDRQSAATEALQDARADALNSGIVEDRSAGASSLLRDAGDSRRSAVGGGHGAFAKGGAAAGRGVPADGDEAAAVASGGLGRATRARMAAVDAFADELDDSEELEGVSDVNQGRRAYGRIRRQAKAARAAESAEAAESGGAGKAGKGASKAVGRADAKTAGTAGKTSEERAAKAPGRRRGVARFGADDAGHRAAAKAAWQQSRALQAARAAETAAATVKASGAKGAVAAVATSAAPAGGVLCGILAFVLGVLMVSQIVSALFGFWSNEASKRSMEGLPSYVTYEMVEEALECQEEYGHPAGCTIAQIIVESGAGDHMSQLATRDHNLFGMKWASSFASAPEVSGKAAWVTSEEYTAGTHTTVTDYFTVFKSDADCIRFRSRVFLQAPVYASNATIQEAIEDRDSDKMAEGLKAAGWATSSTYVESLKSAMETYDLYRFDSMSVDDLRSATSGSVSGSAIVAAAYSQLGVPYVWGGSTPGVGLDCSGLTQYCYRQAGITISHYTEAQYAELEHYPLSQARPGDILYRRGHVAIYIGDDKYIHEPHAGAVCTIASGISYFTCALRAG